MSGKEFFVQRYERLGWKYKDVEPLQAIRINSMNTKKTDKVLRRLQSRGITLKKIPFVDSGYWIQKSEFSVGAAPEYLLGLYSIQEAAAQIPAALFTELKDKIVLDACAAPAGKTIQLADLMRNTGTIIALDVKSQRMDALSNQLERCHVRNTAAYLLDARHASKLKLLFDCILLDMPCSGNFSTDKQWFRRRTIKDIERNAQLQREILTEAAKVLKDEGEIVYSTCSLEPEENEMNIDWALRSLKLEVEEVNCRGHKGLTKAFGKRLDSSIEKCRRIWPAETQGFFVCKLRRSSS
jgi:NOL1/NOP2/sun family putative RNA methylase